MEELIKRSLDKIDNWEFSSAAKDILDLAKHISNTNIEINLEASDKLAELSEKLRLAQNTTARKPNTKERANEINTKIRELTEKITLGIIKINKHFTEIESITQYFSTRPEISSSIEFKERQNYLSLLAIHDNTIEHTPHQKYKPKDLEQIINGFDYQVNFYTKLKPSHHVCKNFANAAGWGIQKGKYAKYIELRDTQENQDIAMQSIKASHSEIYTLLSEMKTINEEIESRNSENAKLKSSLMDIIELMG